MTGIFLQAFIYLFAAVIAVPIAKRCGLGSVLGYLIAGLIIGPVIGLVGNETSTIQHFAEFGVVMMLFLVGLELEPKMLWAMRSRLIGLGGLQLSITTALVMAIAMLMNLSWSISLSIGLIFALSSTAIVLQTMSENHLSKTEGGRNAFSVLLFQDIAVIPMLALLPLLALPTLVDLDPNTISLSEQHEEISLIKDLPGWAVGAVTTFAIVLVVMVGHYLTRPLFRFVASSGLREIFTATALMLIIGISALMGLVGLSPALGTFLAGVVLANSEFRHELESNIQPFKGLLLGLFFITVGAGINLSILFTDFFFIMLLTIGLMLLKVAVLFGLSFIFNISGSARWLFSLSLAQAGEFGFVLLSFSTQKNVLPADIAQILSLVVAMSMFLTPGLFILFDKVILLRFEKKSNEQEPDNIEEESEIIIAGIGRFGQVVNRLLTANGIKTVVLDHEAGQIELLRQINIKSYFGDATRPDLLHTAGIERATLLVVAIDNQESATEIVSYVKKSYPNVKILARAFDRGHAYALRLAGADYVVKETLYSSLEMGGAALRYLGVHPFLVEQHLTTFKRIETESSDSLYQIWIGGEKSENYDNNYHDFFNELEQSIQLAMKVDRLDKHRMTDREWTPPPKDFNANI